MFHFNSIVSSGDENRYIVNVLNVTEWSKTMAFIGEHCHSYHFTSLPSLSHTPSYRGNVASNHRNRIDCNVSCRGPSAFDVFGP